MELLDGGDLYSLIKFTRLDSDKVNALFNQLIRGVVYMHSLLICHRDLKPENIALDTTKTNLKIIDFGSASQLQSNDSMCKGKRGSDPYSAPEEFLEEKYDGFKVDVWSCAIIYLTMVHQQFPWKSANDTSHEFLIYKESGVCWLIDALDNGLKTVLKGMLDPNPQTRYSMQQVANALQITQDQ